MLRDRLIKLFSRMILDELKIYYLNKKEPRGRKNKLELSVYIKYIMRVLFFGEFWSTLNCPECDPSTIRKKFYLWRDAGIFDNIYEQLFRIYCKNTVFKKLFVDSTVVVNKNCSNDDLIDYYYKTASKQQLKIHVICDSNRVPVVAEITNPNVHDSKACREMIKDISFRVSDESYIIGDKAYIIKRRVRKIPYKHIKRNTNRKNDKIKVIAPYRKNQKKTNTETEKECFKKRSVVEHCFAHLKNCYKRLQLIYDKKIENYDCFLIMGITCQMIKIIYKNAEE
jgi:hypothetical protein